MDEAKTIVQKYKLDNYITNPSLKKQLAVVKNFKEVPTELCDKVTFQPMSDDVTEGDEKVEFFKIPKDVKIEFISTEEDVAKLEALLDDGPWIGIDSEWRPNMCRFHYSPIATLQMSGEKNAFVIDMIRLASS
jgi:hypothetical protein